jgi:lysophospholipase L1-like esterase
MREFLIHRVSRAARRQAMPILAILALATAPCRAAGGDDAWVGTWSAAMLAAPIPANLVIRESLPSRTLTRQTLRQFVRLGAGGTQVRLHLDNRYGDRPVRLDAVSLGRTRTDGIDLLPDSIRAVRFSGRSMVTLPAGGTVDSDAVTLPVRTGDTLGISFYVAGKVTPATWHGDARIPNIVSTPGDHTGATRMPVDGSTVENDWLSRVDVLAGADTRAVVALGDSITNGFRASAGAAYPDVLAARLRQAGCMRPVLNAGIDGNQVAAAQGSFGQGESMLVRLGHDVLAVPNARYLIVLGGINDIGEPTMAARAGKRPVDKAPVLAGPVTAALATIAGKAHAHGMRVYGATLPPFGGTGRAWSAEGEAARAAINDWIRTRAPYDAVIDFDAVARDPIHNDRLRPELDSGDHIHPNDAGYRAMAEAIPLSLFDCH